MSERARVHAGAQVLLVLAELSKPRPDMERLLVLRDEIRKSMVDPDLDQACPNCYESLAEDGSCDWC